MTPEATPIDRNAGAFGSTDALDALDRPLAESGAQDAPPGPGRYLLAEQGDEQRLLALTRPITHIGRGFGATLQLEDAGVSRRHAIVMQRRGGVRILDDRSANGTWVNGRRVFEAELHDGDVIALGRVVLVYREVLA
ncbi:MAG TPA: FHA domain-containing protein [Conexibacter sp.]|jgi:pSer/pThr/pTyr-binding forkhead associated (FHA) protein|nr:FHA domain-containing protein [Conexibacter sp.]